MYLLTLPADERAADAAVGSAAADPLIVLSASDLTAFVRCEFAFARKFDQRLGRDIEVPSDRDETSERAARLGDRHEAQILERYRRDCAVVEIAAPAGRPTWQGNFSASRETLDALRGQAEVVAQATFFDPQLYLPENDQEARLAFIGYADFLLKTSDGPWLVQDAKLARRAKTPALLQLAAYAEQLERLGVAVAPTAQLLLGNGEVSEHALTEILPVLRRQRQRMWNLIQKRWMLRGQDGARASAPAIAWNDPAVTACGRCVVCEAEAQRERDLLLVSGLRVNQRTKLHRAAVTTIDALASYAQSAAAIAELAERSGVPEATLEQLVHQAQLQVASETRATPAVEVIQPAAIFELPEPNPGDLFFDFEGDPLYFEHAPNNANAQPSWGLDYLFGWVDADENFSALWAHSLAEEKQALLDFLDAVEERRKQFPGMRVYHYAPYEKTHLLSIASRHGVGEERVDDLLRSNVLVDLYATVRNALRVGSRSYSIKKLEPLYMGSELRDEDGITEGGASIVAYVEAHALLRSGDEAERAVAKQRLDEIADYNRYDCVSTLRLRNWLLGLVDGHAGMHSAAAEAAAETEPTNAQLAAAERSELSQRLERRASEILENPGAHRGEHPELLRMASAAVEYYPREGRSFWLAHYGRLELPIAHWSDDRDVFNIDETSVVEIAPWAPNRTHTGENSIVRVTGTLAPGSKALKADDSRFVIHRVTDPSLPQRIGQYRAYSAKVTQVDGAHLEIRQSRKLGEPASQPIALVPGPPPPTGNIEKALQQFCEALLETPSQRSVAKELILGRPPRFSGGKSLNDVNSEHASAELHERVAEAVALLDRSTLAVQGPPGTGKTFLASRVIRTLIKKRHWKIGVVAQSHAVVENVLTGAVRAGVPAAQVGKSMQRGRKSENEIFTVFPSNGHQRFQQEHSDLGQGYVIGGTAWDFTNRARFEVDQLDLLIIDEAGQFSLAPTIAVSAAAKNLLLLGDPKQLPQVSQAIHSYPVDESALKWILKDEATMPDDLGFFLPESWRMNPELCSVVSEMSYENRLSSAPRAQRQDFSHVSRPGVTWHPQHHLGNTTESPEEAAEVVRLCGEFLRRSRAAEAAELAALSEADIIVVAAYNAQVELIAEALAAAGMTQIRVGTVDKFQGQEAQIGIVSLAASSASDIPRGVEFLLMPNRLNVAVSRAKWACHVLANPALGDTVPGSVEGFAAVSKFLRLLERAQD